MMRTKNSPFVHCGSESKIRENRVAAWVLPWILRGPYSAPQTRSWWRGLAFFSVIHTIHYDPQCHSDKHQTHVYCLSYVVDRTRCWFQLSNALRLYRS